MNHRTKLILQLLCLLPVAVAFAWFAEKSQPTGDSAPLRTEAMRASLAFGPRSEGKPKLLKINRKQSYPGFTLFPVSGPAETLLLNMSGRVVHSWPVDVDRARLLPNCNLLVIHGSKWGTSHEPWASMRHIVREYDWDGNIVWEYLAPDVAHHDIHRLADGDTIFLYRHMLPAELLQGVVEGAERFGSIRSDSILRVNSKGEKVWEWHAHNHLALDDWGRRPREERQEDEERQQKRKKKRKEGGGEKMYDWTHINTVSLIPENRWADEGDLRFRPGNLLVMPRNWWQAMIIDQDSGEVVWKYGGDYKGGIIRGHEIQMIPKGEPGAGNILVFDNGLERIRPESYVLEINPVTKEVQWVYDDGKNFFTRAAGSMQRLPNGNTLISEDLPGKVFEVTPEKQKVWEVAGKYRVHRAFRYNVDFCPQLKGLALYE